MSAVFGIHVGNSSACVALFKDGKVEVIANDSGDRITPTVFAMTETEKMVGLAAKVNMARNSASTIVHNKQFLNESVDSTELEEAIKKSTCKVITEGDGVKYELKCGDKTVVMTPEDIATSIFSKLCAIASSALRSESDLRAVLCVPLHFSQSSRQTVMRAAEEAGLEVLHVISEPGASLMAHGVGVNNPEDESLCLVYRLGGISLDVTVLRVRGGMYSVCSTVHKAALGGDKFTKILAEYLAGEFRQKWKLDPRDSRRSMMKLTTAAETCKHVLSTMSTAHCFVESLCEGVDLSHNITRARFESLIASVLQEYLQPVSEALAKAQIESSSIDKVVLSGGSVKIPKLQQTFADRFSQAEVLGGMNPDEVIAIGAARHGSYLSDPTDPDCELLAMEVSAMSRALYVKQLSAPEFLCVIPAFTPVPVKRVKKYSVQSCAEVWFELYEEKETLLGKVLLRDIETPTQVTVEISISSVGGVHATFTDNSSKKKCSLKLNPPV
ncbi:heat shock 70 kDa protein 14-B [Anabrus simplex]|uniref:heat shock 70 kDa protein 14-B n=1 Tax=Anabrus simplex TaxID=316456 RepID=UPI0035A30412